MRTDLLYKTLFLMMLLLTCVQGSAGAEDDATNPLYWGFALDGFPISQERITSVVDHTGLKPDIILFYLQWPPPDAQRNAPFPNRSLAAIKNQKAVPCVTWEPFYHEGSREIAVCAQEITEGQYDVYVSQFAEACKRYEDPVIIRFAHEMNIARYHWGTTKKKYGPESPQIYKEMFRYVVDRFREEGVNNVLWAFCPNAESVPGPDSNAPAKWNKMARYYPGDDYVDLLGVDGYNWGHTRTEKEHEWTSRWQSFRDIFAGPVGRLRELAPNKPLIVFETGSAQSGGNRKRWLREALRTSRQLDLTAIIWLQITKENDWALKSQEAQLVENKRKKPSTPVQHWAEELIAEEK